MTGLTNSGFIIKTSDQIFSEMLTEARSYWGDTFAQNQSSIEYIEYANRANALGLLWEQLALVYNSLFPDTAEGISLDRACSLVGISRIKGKKSIVRNVDLVNSNSSPITLPAGTKALQSSTNIIWELINNVVIPANGTAQGDFICSIEGEYYCPIGSLNTTIDIIPGWASISNTQDVLINDLGRFKETDAELRLRRERFINKPGTASGLAICNKILEEVPNTIYANYRENRTDTTDSNGLPSHSIEIFVLGGVPLDIAKTIFKYSPAGIQTHGSSSNIVTDEFGNSFVIKHSSLIQKNIYFRIEIDTNTLWMPSYEIELKNIIIDYVNNKHPFNSTLYNWKYYTLLDTLIGVDNIQIFQGFSSNPTVPNTNLTTSVYEKPYTTPSFFTIVYV
jgi:uncharacterized phage protein gp47/JayE